MKRIKPRMFFQNMLNNFWFSLSGGAFLLLFLGTFPKLLVVVLFAAVLFLSGILENLLLFWKRNLSLSLTLFTTFVLGVSAYNFYIALMGKNVDLLIGLMTIAIGMAAFYFLSIIIAFAGELYKNPDFARKDITQRRTENKHLLAIAATAVVIITICSKSSPLYPFNDWTDANCYFTVGKSMLYGKVPYKDLFDHKGPLLHILHAMAALISETSFLGVYVLEVVACAAFLFFSFKTMRLICASVRVVWIPLLATVVYSASCFSHGDSVEELCLPLLAFAIYVGLKALRSEKPLSAGEGVAIGVTAACVLWTKFSIIGFYFGWICIPVIVLVRAGKIKKLFCLFAQIAIGVFALSVPILLYFAANHALSDLWTVYFYDNIFLYSNLSDTTLQSHIFHNLYAGAKNALTYNFSAVLLIGMGFIPLLKKAVRREFWFYALSLIGTFLLVYIGGQSHTYYSLILSAFAPIGMAAIGGGFQVLAREYLQLELSRCGQYCVLGGLWICSAVLAFFLSDNTYLLSYTKDELPQYQFAEIIQKTDNATLLNYGFMEGGFYTTTGIIPSCRYFCTMNILQEEMLEKQTEVVLAGGVDFVVTCDVQLNLEQYRCVADAAFIYEGLEHNYYLYQLN